jgi:serine/threonine protein phosphatase 1
VALKANHDAMMVEALRDLSRMAAWIGTGGDTRLASHGGDAAAVPQAHITWLVRFRLMHVDAHRVYVHAGVDPEIALDQQSEARLLWKRYSGEIPEGFGDLRVVHGHDNSPEGPLPYEGRTNWVRWPGEPDC